MQHILLFDIILDFIAAYFFSVINPELVIGPHVCLVFIVLYLLLSFLNLFKSGYLFASINSKFFIDCLSHVVISLFDTRFIQLKL